MTLGAGETVNGGGGNNSITVTAASETVHGGSGNNTITVTSAAALGATIDGGTGSSTLMLSAGGTEVMGNNITGIAEVQLAAKTTLTANNLADLKIIGSAGGGDTITLGASSQSVISGGPNEHIRASQANAGAAVSGLGVGSELEITSGGTVILNSDTGGSAGALLLVKLDAVTNLMLSPMQFITANGSNGSDTITAGAANQTLIGGTSDNLTGYAGGGDLFQGTAAGLKNDTISNFMASDQIDVTNLAPGLATLTAAASGLNTLVTLKSGGTQTSFLMTGSFAQSGFVLSNDAATGTLVTYH